MAGIRVGVIGNGIAGFSAACTIRRLSNHCEVSVISTEPTPLYSACVLPDYISGEISRENTFVKTTRDYEQLGIHTLFGREVLEIDPTLKSVTMDNGEALSFDRLILAMGSEPIVLGERKKGVFKIKTLNDADELLVHRGKKAVVVGSGPIGIEVAIALHHNGYEVTIVEMLERVIPLALDQRVADRVEEILEEHEIRVLTGERATKVVGGSYIEALETNKRELVCDTLIWAIGMRPRVELAAGAGIEIGQVGGIKVNSRMETNAPGVYACGDCVETNDILSGKPSLNLFWHNANRQGSVAAHNCLGLSKEYPGSQNILNIDVFGNHIAGFGFTVADLHRFKDIKALKGRLSDLSIIERERDRGYYRLIIVRDRCMGGQFINITKDLGLLWSVMFQGKSIAALLRVCENEELMRRRPWVRRVGPFFKG